MAKETHKMGAHSTIQINEDYIRQLREENESLRKKLAKAGDEKVIRRAFQNRGSEMNAFIGMSVEDAIKKLDGMVLCKKVHLDAMKHTTENYQQRLDELKMECNLKRPEGSGGAASSDVWAGEEDAKMKIRALKTSLKKTKVKLRKAERIGAHRLELKKQLQDEIRTYQAQLDSLEAELLKQRKVLHNMEVKKEGAQLSKEAAKFYDKLEEKLPESNTVMDDEDKSEEDDPDVPSSEALKLQSQQMVNPNVKKARK